MTQPTLDEWRRLYDVAQKVHDLAPWQWMEESDLFGVQNPENDDLGFVSVMGMAGEYFAVGMYLGAKGLYGFWDIQDNAPFVHPMEVLQVPQLQVSFGSRDETDDHDRQIIKSLGLKFRGKHAWITFRSYRAGFMPWYLEGHEARFLAAALEQLLEVAPRVRDDPNILLSEDERFDDDDEIEAEYKVALNGDFDDDDEDDEFYEESCLVRVPHHEGDTLRWDEQFMTIPVPEEPQRTIALDMDTLGKLKQLPRQNNTFEIGVFMLPTPVAEKRGERPFFPYVLLAVDKRSGAIVGNDMMQPLPSLDSMWTHVPGAVMQGLTSLGFIPKEIHVGTPLMMELLQPLANASKFKLRLQEFLPALNAVQEELSQFTGGGIVGMGDETLDDFPFDFPNS